MSVGYADHSGNGFGARISQHFETEQIESGRCEFTGMIPSVPKRRHDPQSPKSTADGPDGRLLTVKNLAFEARIAL